MSEQVILNDLILQNLELRCKQPVGFPDSVSTRSLRGNPTT